VANDGLALVPVRLQPVSDEAPLAAHYLPASLAARTYPWQPEPVDTVAVWSSIVTSGTEGCEAIGVLARISIDHLAWLRANGHPK
jgi:hypothetical protein